MIDLTKLVRPNILNLMPYASARDEYKGKRGVFLDANENPFGCHNRYPDPYQCDLKKALAKLKNIGSENILIGNGSDEIIDLALRIFCKPGRDKVVCFSPSYGMYDVSAAINDVELIKLPLTREFQIDMKSLDFKSLDPSIKLMFICSPNNPTGNLMNRSDIEKILDQFQGVVFIDEAYIDFADEESMINLVKENNHLIVSQTFSKAWGLAAVRIGVAYASKEIIQIFNKVKPPYNVSSINQEAALDAISQKELFEAKLEFLLRERERLVLSLGELEMVQKIYPSQANFLLVEVKDANRLYDQLIERKIIVRNRSSLVNNCLRISVGTPEENKILINTLKAIR